jgi:arsenate reductase (thioredoxin)
MRPRPDVLFVCIGNSCRSQMAQAFARAHGRDVMIPDSAGVYPAIRIAPDTIRAMKEKNISLDDQSPKSIEQVDRTKYDLIVDMSGGGLEYEPGENIRVWDVPDPIVMDYENHRKVRDQIQALVLDLIAELRANRTRRTTVGVR